MLLCPRRVVVFENDLNVSHDGVMNRLNEERNVINGKPRDASFFCPLFFLLIQCGLPARCLEKT